MISFFQVWNISVSKIIGSILILVFQDEKCNHIVNKGWLKISLKKLQARATEKYVCNIEVVDSDSAPVNGEEHFSYYLDTESSDFGMLNAIIFR